MYFTDGKVSGYNHSEWVGMLRFRHLGDLDKLQKVFEKVVLRAIRFAPESIEAEIALL